MHFLSRMSGSACDCANVSSRVLWTRCSHAPALVFCSQVELVYSILAPLFLSCDAPLPHAHPLPSHTVLQAEECRRAPDVPTLQVPPQPLCLPSTGPLSLACHVSMWSYATYPQPRAWQSILSDSVPHVGSGVCSMLMPILSEKEPWEVVVPVHIGTVCMVRVQGSGARVGV